MDHKLETQTMVGEGFILNKDKLGVLHIEPYQKITIRYIPFSGFSQA